MTAYYAGASAPSFAVANRLEAYAATAEFDRPTLVIDVDRVETQFEALKAGLGRADIHYAVKATRIPRSSSASCGSARISMRPRAVRSSCACPKRAP